MRIHYLIHVAEELPGAISNWAKSKGFHETYTLFYLNENLPELNAIDMLVVMGGPMNIYEHEAYPWLLSEKEFIGKAVNAGKKVLGVCLGAQLLADVMGGEVVRNEKMEIGWFPVELTTEGLESSLFHSIEFAQPVLHWHGDRFNIPPGATHLLRSGACANQAFSMGNNVLALQFHFEMILGTLDKIIALDRASLQKAEWVMNEEEIRSGAKYLDANNHILFQLLDRFVEW